MFLLGLNSKNPKLILPDITTFFDFNEISKICCFDKSFAVCFDNILRSNIGKLIRLVGIGSSVCKSTFMSNNNWTWSWNSRWITGWVVSYRKNRTWSLSWYRRIIKGCNRGNSGFWAWFARTSGKLYCSKYGRGWKGLYDSFRKTFLKTFPKTLRNTFYKAFISAFLISFFRALMVGFNSRIHDYWMLIINERMRISEFNNIYE